jgi:hypothetical protein
MEATGIFEMETKTSQFNVWKMEVKDKKRESVPMLTN